MTGCFDSALVAAAVSPLPLLRFLKSFPDQLTAEAQRRGGSLVFAAPRLRVSAVIWELPLDAAREGREELEVKMWFDSLNRREKVI